MEKGDERKIKTYRLLVVLGVALVVLSGFFSSGISQVRASGESPNADDGPHTIPTNGGVYDTLTQVQIVTPTTIYAENWTYAYQVRWFMDEAPMDTDGLSLRAVESTPTNITWQAILQNPPSPGNHSFTFRVIWSNSTVFEDLLEWMRGLWMEDFSGSFTITHTYVHYDFDESLDWTVVGGTWSVLNGSLDGFSSAEGLIYTSDMIWKDCMLTAKVKVAADSPRAEAAFCVCFVDSGNFYWAGFGCWGHRVSISRMVDHVSEELVFSGDSADIVKDVWYNLSIEVSGDAISLYVNDVLELVVNDSTFTGGVVGTRTWDSHVLVDHVTVSGLPSISTPPSKTEAEVYYGFGEDWALNTDPSDTNAVLSKWSSLLSKADKWKFNTVRLAFRFPKSPSTSNTAITTVNYETLDNLLELLDSKGVKAIMDLHNYEDMYDYFGSDSWIQHWIQFSQKYKGDSRIIAYELFNEAFGSTWDEAKIKTKADVARAFARCTDAIRQIEPKRTVLWGAPYFDYQIPSDAVRENVIYYAHAWTWGSAVENVADALEKAESKISRWNSFIQTYNIKNFWLGEFGLRGGSGYDASEAFCLSLINWCVEHGYGFNLWLYHNSHHIGNTNYYDALLEKSDYFERALIYQ